MKLRFDARTIFCVLLALLVFAWPFISSPIALALGLIVGFLSLNPFLPDSKTWTPKLLSKAVIGLGFGVNLKLALTVGAAGFLYTAVGITLTLIIGFGLGRLLKQNDRISLLLATGTAICGGSAIASVAPVIHAKQEEISLALGIVFLLNAIALFIFPPIGHYFELSQSQFGLWAALAIHDTSSVVGATFAYGDEALKIGTTVKLARALWIVPVTMALGFLWTKFAPVDVQDGPQPKRKYPWFILGFLAAAAVYTWIPALSEVCHALEFLAKRLMVLTLFVIGANLNRKMLQGMGLRPVIQGASLWLLISSVTLLCVVFNVIAMDK